MSEDKKVTPAELSLKQLLGILSVGQLRAIIGIIVVLVGGSFGFGMLVNEVRTTSALDTARSKLDTAQSDLDTAQSKLDTAEKRYTLQIEFLERSYAYLNARIKGKEDALNDDSNGVINDARFQFASTLERMYKGGDRNLQKADGYEFDESEAGNHKVIFDNEKIYRIFRDVKGNFIDQLR